MANAVAWFLIYLYIGWIVGVPWHDWLFREHEAGIGGRPPDSILWLLWPLWGVYSVGAYYLMLVKFLERTAAQYEAVREEEEEEESSGRGDSVSCACRNASAAPSVVLTQEQVSALRGINTDTGRVIDKEEPTPQWVLYDVYREYGTAQPGQYNILRKAIWFGASRGAAMKFAQTRKKMLTDDRGDLDWRQDEHDATGTLSQWFKRIDGDYMRFEIRQTGDAQEGGGD